MRLRLTRCAARIVGVPQPDDQHRPHQREDLRPMRRLIAELSNKPHADAETCLLRVGLPSRRAARRRTKAPVVDHIRKATPAEGASSGEARSAAGRDLARVLAAGARRRRRPRRSSRASGVAPPPTDDQRRPAGAIIPPPRPPLARRRRARRRRRQRDAATATAAGRPAPPPFVWQRSFRGNALK